IADDALRTVGDEWKRLRKLAPANARLWALLKFPGGVPPVGGKTATLTITPEFRMLSSTTPGGWFVTYDDDLPIQSDIGCDLFLLPKGTYRVTVKRPGFATLERRVTLPAVDAGKPLEFEMTPGDSITGRIVNTRGEPIENAVVKTVERHHLPHSLTQYTTANLPREPRTTDAAGQFAFADLYEGSYTFEISAAGFETLRVTHIPVGRQNQKIVLRTPAEEREREEASREREDQARRAADDPESLAIVGTLVNDVTGEPVEGATIACGAFINETGGGGANAVTDAQGRFRLVPPSAGIYNVSVKKYEFDPQMTAIADDGVRVILGKPAQSHLRLVKGRRVVGRLVDPAGDPVEGSTIGCYSLAHPQSTGGVESRKTDAQGEFEFHLPPGPVRVYVMGALFRDGLTADASFEVPDEGELPTLRLKLAKAEQRFGVPDWVRRSTPGTRVLSQKKAADITGTVVDTQGKPLPGALVFRTDGPLVPTGAKGEFRVAVDKGTQLVMFAFVEGYHVWFGTPTAGDVLKIVMETKERPKRIPVKPSSPRDDSSQKSQEPDDRQTVPDKAGNPKAEATPGGKLGPGAKEQARNSKLKVQYNIPGVTEPAAIVVECNGEQFGTNSNGRVTTFPLASGKRLELTDLPSGDCFVARNRRVELVRLSPTNFFTRNVLLDARRFQVQVNDDQTVDFSRPNGKPLKGRVLGLKESGLERALIYVCSEEIRDARMAQRAGERGAGTVSDIRPCAADGTFETEPLLPGRYVLVAGGYVAPPASEKYKLSDLEPRYVAIAHVEVPKTDQPEHVELRLADTRTLDHPVTVDADEISVREAMAVACERADVGLEFDREALQAASFDGNESREIHAHDRPLGEVLRELIRWNENPEVTIEFRDATVTLTTHSAQATRLKARLPEWLRPLYGNGLIAQLDASGEVTSLSVNGIADDAFLENLKRLPKLRELHIEVTKEITVEGLTHLVDLQAIEKLSCYDVNAEGQGLGDAVLVAAARISTLRSLSLNHCGVTNAGLEPLLSMPELRELHLGQNLLSDPGLKYLAGLKELRTLNLNCTVGSVHYGRMQFTDAGLAHLARLSKLEDLDLTGQPISARSLVFPKLKTLSVGGSEIDDEAAAQIGKCRDLRSLSLVYSSITNDGLTAIATLPNLVQLNIDSDQIGDEGIAHLADLTSLEILSLRSTRVGDRSLGHLAKIGSLRRLDLHGSGVPGSFTGELFTVAGLKQLQALPRLQALSIQNLRSKNGFKDLAALERLQSLTLFMSNISEEDTEFLEEHLPRTQVFAASGGGKFKLRSKKGAKPGTTVILPADPK
ncbi:MAG: carboxypeptidase regulatory-like domain-containing protein, partial [Planctomycetota bacterium]|nr:carboxypeptidase regulatory-like domain-containing protein [Planctomycetota bacterium]